MAQAMPLPHVLPWLPPSGQDRITAYGDPRSLTTSYIRDGFGDVIQRTSPDTGTTVIVSMCPTLRRLRQRIT
jgi:YD repeat-containing protein